MQEKGESMRVTLINQVAVGQLGPTSTRLRLPYRVTGSIAHGPPGPRISSTRLVAFVSSLLSAQKVEFWTPLPLGFCSWV